MENQLVQNQALQMLLDTLQKEKEEFENAKVKIGVTGLSGAGKSTLINSLMGEEVAETGYVETTMEKKGYQYKNIELWDMPGMGTDTFPRETYVEKMNLKELDAFIIVTRDRIYTDDTYLYNEIRKMNIPCFVVRTHMDNVIKSLKTPEKVEEVIKVIEKDFKKKLPNLDRVYLVSNEPLFLDLPILERDIANSLDSIKRQRFLADAATLSKEILEAKIAIAQKIVRWHSVGAAANGFNIIPGTDIALDVAILSNMVNEINNIFGLTEKDLNELEMKYPTIKKLDTYQFHKQAIKQMLAKYAAKEGIMQILKQSAKTLAVKEVGKYILFVGPFLAAGVNAKLCASFGEEYYIQAKENAELIFNDLSKSMIEE